MMNDELSGQEEVIKTKDKSKKIKVKKQGSYNMLTA